MKRSLWRAPLDDGAIFIDPPLPEMAQLLRANQIVFEHPASAFGQESLLDLRRRLRAEITFATVNQFAPLWQQPYPNTSAPWVVTGHQPELFHPGVWLKNYVASELARRHDGAALHISIDADTVKVAGFRMPLLAQDPALVRLAFVPFDRPDSEPPFEHWYCHDESLFDATVSTVQEVAQHWGFAPLLMPFWRQAQAFRAAALRKPVGLRFAYARRQIERSWGCDVVDVVLSALCRTTVFAVFMSTLMTRCTEFHDVYNRCLRTYRKKYHVRSSNHPAPDLHHAGGWFELPFWVLGGSPAVRNRLFVRRRGHGFELRSGQHGTIVETSGTAAALAELFRTSDWQVRTRALTTTLFVRLFLADLFIHGIGGAKYEEVNDQLLHDFFGVAAPKYGVVSGTLRLPVPHFPSDATGQNRLHRQLRDLDWNPDRFINPMPETSKPLVAALQELRCLTPSYANEKRRRFEELRQLIVALRPSVSTARQLISQQMRVCNAELAANAVLQRRDYAFVLFPEEKLRRFLTQLG